MHRYGLYALQWIVEVNGKQTPNLDAFLDATKVSFPCMFSLNCALKNSVECFDL